MSAANPNWSGALSVLREDNEASVVLAAWLFALNEVLDSLCGDSALCWKEELTG